MSKKNASIGRLIGCNIKKYRSLRDLKVKHAAKMADVTVQTWYKWERGEIIPDETNKTIIASVLEISAANLRDGLDSAPKKRVVGTENKEPPFPRIYKTLDKSVVIGTRGIAAADDSGGSKTPDTDEQGESIRLPDSLVMVPVTGDSMSPVVLEKQFVIIDREREGFEKDGGIYVVSILEPSPQDDRDEPITGTFVKRCQREEDMYYLKSINDYSPFSVYVDHCRLWPVLGTWYDDMGKPPEGF